MKISLLPLYSKLNGGVGACALGCLQTCKVKQQAPNFGEGNNCPLSSHQAETYHAIINSDAEIIFNTSATGDGKSLAAYLASLLNSDFQVISLYPTIELVADQKRQIINYYEKFNLAEIDEIESLYGAKLAELVEQGEKTNKFKELLKILKHKYVILTNPDIFHLATHSRYINPAYSRAELAITLGRNPDLYIADEFHIFGSHQEAAILNSLLLIRHNRPKKRPMRVLFTSATPKDNFVKLLKNAGFKVTSIKGEYESKPTAGYRQICQTIDLDFVQLDRESDAFNWLIQEHEQIRNILHQEGKGRGGIILNSVALVSRTVRELQKLIPDIKVREISGRIDKQEREKIHHELENSQQPVLIVGTSAVDVGVDFRIHLLIFEASDSATFIQRLGRLGRHSGFNKYQAFVLLSSRTPWIKSRLEEKLTNAEYDRDQFQEIITEVFNAPTVFTEYPKYWGALQAQGMLFSMGSKKVGVIEQLKDKISEDLRLVYGEQLDKKRGHWFALGKDEKGVGKAVQQELLRFRGSSDLQAAVWDEGRFYTYDLLRLLAYAEVEIIDREEFLKAAINADHPHTEFPEKYIQVYLKVQKWSDQRYNIELESDRSSDEIKQCILTFVDKLSIIGHPQTEVNRCLKRQKLLGFLVPVNRTPNNSHWQISQTLYLSPTFGLYRLKDSDGQFYSCAFNQDALLLEAVKWKIRRCERSKPYIF
ncbi:type I-D CRISPR-associated helicase Cas3' [Sphaerospermopsis sp. LEGE 08334]|uniref:type I-D CRISPR-associated helicase Cas3' n=1 Tax=Sphaerospermopsis sp. LEGE 08334 TaxID=1828651 RepID=UPI001880A61C|nr:type I-D CRISPR-associated helicase Cas3' [Sphaerospermopsis sp. LEGE 08334]MBE9058371.1 type I-D CRISPR-associated helicase Cas3' [Sphaerospermopsis sp. LEGE 08334]